MRDAFETDYLVIGAGAAGLSAAKLLAVSEKGARTTLVDAHAEPGGSAGFFARGAPRRILDAGATQLAGCEPGGLQDRLLLAGTAARSRPFAPTFVRIPELTHHFLDEGARLTLTSDGRASYVRGSMRVTLDSQGARVDDARTFAGAGADEPTSVLVDDLRALQRILAVCEREAAWMWKVFDAVPRFPFEIPGDIARAITLAGATPLSRMPLFPLLASLSFAGACETLGLRKEHVIAHEVLAGLLLDTTQNPPESSPWLAGLMGVSILRRGIHRAEGGMRAFFKALLSDARAEGARVLWHRRATRIEPSPSGHWRVTLLSHQDGSESVVTVRKGLVCNLTLWDLCDIVVPTDDIMATRTHRSWKEAASAEVGWGAFAIYATFEDLPALPDAPWFHQVFPRECDEGTLAREANYVSISGRQDPSNPKNGRVLTTTLHVPARPFDSQERTSLMNALVERTEHALGVTLENVESATPETYARYTGRKNGQVGGFRMSRERFLFNAPHSFLRVQGMRAPLAVAGDTVFPGQGVIACLMSGIIAWERITGRAFKDLR